MPNFGQSSLPQFVAQISVDLGQEGTQLLSLLACEEENCVWSYSQSEPSTKFNMRIVPSSG